MPKNLYVISTQDFTGKSAVCVALMQRMQQDGYSVGYLKPVSSIARVLGESGVDEDARLVKETFNLNEPVNVLAPVVLTNTHLKEILAGGGVNYTDKVKQAAETVGRGRDVVVVEGGANFREGYVVDLSPVETANLLDAQAVAVVGYRGSLQVVDDALTAATRFGDRLLGVLINAVPEEREEYVNSLVKPYLKKHNVDVLAVMPYQKRLRAVDVSEIVHSISGELICYDCLDDLVENLVVASMGVEHTLEQFKRVENKAVVVGGDRPDIQVDALETSTKALILTGNLRPTPMIQEQADLLGVAIILSPFDTLTTIEKVEGVFERSRFHQSEKVKDFQNLLSRKMDFERFYRKIGLEK